MVNIREELTVRREVIGKLSGKDIPPCSLERIDR